MKKSLATVLGLITLSGCASHSTSYTPEGMKVATQELVKGCTFVGDVHGVSGAYGVFAKNGLANARQAAFEQAQQMGGNTIVWQPFSTQYGSTSAHGNAYKCP